MIRIPLDAHEKIDTEYLEKMLQKYKKREIIASFSVASNVTGIVTIIEVCIRLSNVTEVFYALIFAQILKYTVYQH